MPALYAESTRLTMMIYLIRWDEKAGLRRDAVGSQVINVLEAQADKGDRQ